MNRYLAGYTDRQIDRDRERLVRSRMLRALHVICMHFLSYMKLYMYIYIYKHVYIYITHTYIRA